MVWGMGKEEWDGCEGEGMMSDLTCAVLVSGIDMWIFPRFTPAAIASTTLEDTSS